MLHASWICSRVSALVYTKMMHCIYPCTWHGSLYIAYVRRHGLREDSLALRGKTWNSPTGTRHTKTWNSPTGTRHMVLRYPRWDRGSFDPSGRGDVLMCCIPWEHVLSPVILLLFYSLGYRSSSLSPNSSCAGSEVRENSAGYRKSTEYCNS